MAQSWPARVVVLTCCRFARYCFIQLEPLFRISRYVGAASILAIALVVFMVLTRWTPKCLLRVKPGMDAFLAAAVGSHSYITFKMVAEMIKVGGRNGGERGIHPVFVLVAEMKRKEEEAREGLVCVCE